MKPMVHIITFPRQGRKVRWSVGQISQALVCIKQGGSLTQSSVLLIKEERVKITSIQKRLTFLIQQVRVPYYLPP